MAVLTLPLFSRQEVALISAVTKVSSADDVTIIPTTAASLEDLLQREQRLIALYEDLAGITGGKLAAVDGLLTSLLSEQQEHVRVLTRFTRDREVLDAVRKIEASHDRIMADLEQQVISNSRLQRLSEDIHEYLIALSLGLQIDELRLRRFLPIRVYLSQDDADLVDRVSKAVVRFAEDDLRLSISFESEAELGYWFKRWCGKTKDFMTQPEVAERLKKGERTLELATLSRYQAEVDKIQSEAAAALVNSLQPIQEAVVQIGSLLLIKAADPDIGPRIVVRSLSQRELAILEENPSLLRNPRALLDSLRTTPVLENGNSKDAGAQL